MRAADSADDKHMYAHAVGQTVHLQAVVYVPSFLGQPGVSHHAAAAVRRYYIQPKVL
jgi:hypothetical protein